MSKKQERTAGNDRIRITYHDDGTARIEHMVLGGEGGLARRRGKPVFETIATIDIPAALVGFVRDALGFETPAKPGAVRFIREEAGRYVSDDGKVVIEERSGKSEKVWVATEGKKMISHGETFSEVRDNVLVLRGGPDPKEMARVVGGHKMWRKAFAYGVRVERLRAEKERR